MVPYIFEVDTLNKKLLIVLGIFWLVLVPIAAAGAVAADGLYWGDCASTAVVEGDEPVVWTYPLVIFKDKPVFTEPVLFSTCGLYWGD